MLKQLLHSYIYKEKIVLITRIIVLNRPTVLITQPAHDRHQVRSNPLQSFNFQISRVIT